MIFEKKAEYYRHISNSILVFFVVVTRLSVIWPSPLASDRLCACDNGAVQFREKLRVFMSENRDATLTRIKTLSGTLEYERKRGTARRSDLGMSTCESAGQLSTDHWAALALALYALVNKLNAEEQAHDDF